MCIRPFRVAWPSGEGEVVEILEGLGMRRAKIVAAGVLVEVAPLDGGELHLGDRIAFDLQPSPCGTPPAWRIDVSNALDCLDDADVFPGW